MTFKIVYFQNESLSLNFINFRLKHLIVEIINVRILKSQMKSVCFQSKYV